MSNLGHRLRRFQQGNAAEGITVESSRTDQITDSSSTFDMDLPGTPAEDDIYIVAMSSDGNPGSTLGDAAIAGGWTRLFLQGTNDPTAGVLLKRMGGTPDTTVPIEGGSSNEVEIIIIQVKGVDTTTALDAALTSASGSSGMPNPPSHTTVTNGAMRIITGHLDDDLVTGSLTGWTVLSKNGGSGGRNSSVMLGYKIAETAGAENPGAFSGGGTDEWAATHFSLRPA